MPNSPSESFHFHATPYGVVSDHRVALRSKEDYDAAREWASELDGHGVDRVETAEGMLRFRVNGNAPFDLPLSERLPEESLGGNTWNTWSAVMRVVGSLAPERLGEFPLHAFSTRKLEAGVHDRETQHEALGWPKPEVILKVTDDMRIRCSHVLCSPHGEDPLYLPRTPLPETTGEFPDASWVFVSSAGPDLYPEILEHRRKMQAQSQTPYLHLAPGSAQVRRGIPEEVLSGVHFLSCNWEEAVQLAKHLKARLGPEPQPYDLVEFFGTLGVDELRITHGERGVHAWSDQGYIKASAFSRNNPSIRALVHSHGLANEGSPTWTNPDLTGCGDTRLGAELALRHLGIGDLQQQLCAANAMAAFQTFNPASNIGNFPPDLIREVVENVVHRSWWPIQAPMPKHGGVERAA